MPSKETAPHPGMDVWRKAAAVAKTTRNVQCENILPKETWPFARRCTNVVTFGPTQVLVGRRAGTWDPIYETHDVCSSCLASIEHKEDDEPTAWDRDESEACQRGTPGCSVEHTRDSECQPW